jgi:hypothetical protein
MLGKKSPLWNSDRPATIQAIAFQVHFGLLEKKAETSQWNWTKRAGGPGKEDELRYVNRDQFM